MNNRVYVPTVDPRVRRGGVESLLKGISWHSEFSTEMGLPIIYSPLIINGIWKTSFMTLQAVLLWKLNLEIKGQQSSEQLPQSHVYEWRSISMEDGIWSAISYVKSVNLWVAICLRLCSEMFDILTNKATQLQNYLEV